MKIWPFYLKISTSLSDDGNYCNENFSSSPAQFIGSIILFVLCLQFNYTTIHRRYYYINFYVFQNTWELSRWLWALKYYYGDPLIKQSNWEKIGIVIPAMKIKYSYYRSCWLRLMEMLTTLLLSVPCSLTTTDTKINYILDSG